MQITEYWRSHSWLESENRNENFIWTSWCILCSFVMSSLWKWEALIEATNAWIFFFGLILKLLSFVFSPWQIFIPSEKIENINDQYWTLRAEEVSMPYSLLVNKQIFLLRNSFLGWQEFYDVLLTLAPKWKVNYYWCDPIFFSLIESI